MQFWLNFFLNLIVMTTAFAPLKCKIAYLKSPTHFLPKFGCHGNCADFREILDSINEFADPENLTIYAIYAINSSIFAQN